MMAIRPYVTLLCTLVAGQVLAGAGDVLQPPAGATPGVTRGAFGKMPDGQAVEMFTLTNKNGVEIRAITYGGIITSIKVPDRDGRMGDVVLGFDSIDGYLGEHPFFGAIIGRYGNRIAKAQFALDGRTYTLAANN